MLGVGLSLLSAVLFGAMSIALGFAVRKNDDAEAGAFVSAFAGFLVCGVVAAVRLEWGGELWPFVLAGLVAPGGSQLLFVLAVRESGPARASVIAGTAPLVAVTIAIVALDEPLRVPLIAGALLIVVGSLALATERVRPDRFRAIGLLFAFGCTVFFATRDNIVRWLATDTDVAPQLAASVTILSGSVLLLVYLTARRRTRVLADIRRAAGPYLLPGLFWGASYSSLFEAFYRARVSVVSPLAAAESLFAVLFAVLLLRRSELVGRPLIVGAVLIVAGGALIGAFR